MICPKCNTTLKKVNVEKTDNENYRCSCCGTKWLIVDCGVI